MGCMVAAPGRQPTPRGPEAFIFWAVGLASRDPGPKKEGPKTVFWMPKTFFFLVKQQSVPKLGAVGAFSKIQVFAIVV